MRLIDKANTPLKRGRPGYDQESVLRIAVEAFNEHGYEATSMGKLADRLGISKSAIYHHVPSKEDLLRLALDEALIPLEAVIIEVRAHQGSADERLDFFLRATFRILISKRSYVTLLLRLRGNTELERAALERRRAMDRQLAELVTAAQSEGELRADLDPRATARLLFGLINSVVDWFREDGPIEAKTLEDQAITLLFDGLHSTGA
ncbi:TetR/AcrR family transcriptional regulator [Glutamicibacter sp. AOP38-B1-38]|uniref:TetR/AcrR family transcriptional regulator n=1 Tax=Glutamicibacter sp. AOP38-B1-38 TaxID=3457680 RepID=UPI004033F7FD